MSKKQSKKKAYAEAGVDIALADKLLGSVKPWLKQASRPESLGSIGGFGGFFDISKTRCKHPVLVSSTDSVGTKVTAARIVGNYSNLGADIVNHCANDIAVCGAEPLYFLDYYATGQLDRNYVTLMKGLAKACKASNIALVGGETAELPGVYNNGECDLVGTIVGVVDKPRILTGKAIRPGDVLVGLASSGLHTNGFSLARKILFKDMKLKPEDTLPGFRSKVGNALMQAHVNYSGFLLEAFKKYNKGSQASKRRGNAIFGAAHITGGGFTGNVPRILPENCSAIINTKSWKPLPVFQTMVSGGKVDFEEAYEVFNMGIGMVLAVSPDVAANIVKLAGKHKHKAVIVGEVIKGDGSVELNR
ncbi:phosphoribosylformylglycinamidine cyclo-ligase [Puniceicoccales bacterium CK1056]|uniref:Phosphoribosylformylglycinamidine cyclo-ligase n=1 Tax=Oceanipulchritudo coccoides TaxID=2706888 RepID=A0A6B2LXZ9_9BACT|nr:phosphoribosylformylglycinamidine cyclo-ligase [Oceanipulchritudo coccoides]NDV61203.1 phosphoribosylformylglycinamidine cyclo-ligase [Oceanipulchritudo coccoides]